MSRLAEHLFLVVITLWVGALWAVGYMAAPTLFATLPNRMLAGEVAGRMFALLSWVGIGSAAYLLLFLVARLRWRAFRGATLWLVVVMLVLTLAGHFGIQPLMAQMKAQAWPREVMQSVLRDRFATWHGISSVLYLLQSVLGLFLVLAGRRAVP